MSEEFVQVRRKDDHTVLLQPLAASALPHFPDWEPITPEPEPGPEPVAEEPPTTRRPRTTARKAKEGDV